MSRIGEFYGNTGERAKKHPVIASVVGLGILAAGAAGLDHVQDHGIDLPNLSTVEFDLPDLPKIGGQDSPENPVTTEAPVTTTTAVETESAPESTPESTTTTVAPIETTTTIAESEGVDLSPVEAPGQ